MARFQSGVEGRRKLLIGRRILPLCSCTMYLRCLAVVSVARIKLIVSLRILYAQEETVSHRDVPEIIPLLIFLKRVDAPVGSKNSTFSTVRPIDLSWKAVGKGLEGF